MTRVKFLCDTERCIDCNGCVVACNEGNEVPVAVNRRRVITIHSGKPGEKSVSVSCMHCTDAPCIAVCPVKAMYQREDGIVLVEKKACIGCGYCFMACPFGVPRFAHGEVVGARGAMDKCSFCAEEKQLHGQDRITADKAPRCAGMCSTRALLAGDADVIADVYRERVFRRGSGDIPWGWDKAYEKE